MFSIVLFSQFLSLGWGSNVLDLLSRSAVFINPGFPRSSFLSLCLSVSFQSALITAALSLVLTFQQADRLAFYWVRFLFPVVFPGGVHLIFFSGLLLIGYSFSFSFFFSFILFIYILAVPAQIQFSVALISPLFLARWRTPSFLASPLLSMHKLARTPYCVNAKAYARGL